MSLKARYEKFVEDNKTIKIGFDVLIMALMYETIDCIKWANNDIDLTDDEMKDLYLCILKKIQKSYPQPFTIDIEGICRELGYEF